MKDEVKRIISKMEKAPKIAIFWFALGLIFVAISSVGIFLYLKNNDIGLPIIVIGEIIAFSLIIIGAIQRMSYKHKLSGISIKKVKEDLNNNYVSFSKEESYFTNNYILSDYYKTFIIKYIDIAWVYKEDKKGKDGTVTGTDLVINLVNGRKERLPYLNEFEEIIKNHNSNILYSYSIDNKKAYKEIVSNYKKYKQNERETNTNKEIKLTKPLVEVNNAPVAPPTEPPKKMIDIDPLYNIPGMSGGNSSQKASTTDFLMMNDAKESEVKSDELPVVTQPQLNVQEKPTSPQQTNNNPFIN